jgi:hypothetical protein
MVNNLIPQKTIALGSPVSSTLAELHLQFFEELINKHWKERGEISYYNMDVVLKFDQNKTNDTSINNNMNNINENLEFKKTEEEKNNTNYLDLSIYIYNNKLNLGIYRKHTQAPLYISHSATR